MKGPQRVLTDYGHSIYTSHGTQHGILARTDAGDVIGRLVWNGRRIGNGRSRLSQSSLRKGPPEKSPTGQSNFEGRAP